MNTTGIQRKEGYTDIHGWGCREMGSSKQGKVWLAWVPPSPEIYPLKKKKMANDSHLSLRSML